MPVNIPSTLLKIYTNSTSEDPQETRRIINSLPKNLRNKIHQIIQDSKSIKFSQKTQEALGKIAQESFEGLDKKSKSKTQAIFSRICNQPNTQDSFEASNNVLQKLRALESVTTINKVNEWAGGDKIKQKVAAKIVEFINNPAQTELDISAEEMDRIKDLPDIFDDIGISSRLTKLDISNRGLDSIPASIASLTNLTELNLSHNCLNPVPRCIEKLENLSKLSLRSNQLQTLPDFIANLPRLTTLNLAKNKFRTIPQIIYNMNNLQFLSFFANQIESISAEISNLSSLRILNLTNNQLRDLPNSILDLSASCELNLENSGLSNTVLDRIRDASLEEHYTGPRILFSVHEENLEIIANPTINDSLDILFSKAGVSNFYGFENNFPKLHQYTIKKHTYQSLSSWLSRLSLMQQSAREGESGLAKKIISYLELAQHNDDFRESFFNLIHGAAATCGDRMALSVLHLGLQYNLTSMDKSNLKKFADFLIHGPWMVDQLEQIAREKVQTLRFVDEIEVFLAYPVKLKNKLDIQIDVSEMLYFRCSGVTIEDLDAAESSIKEMISGNDSIPNILVQRKDWMDALTLNFPDEMSAILEERDIESEKPGDIDYVRILQTYTQKTVDLTKRAIS